MANYNNKLLVLVIIVKFIIILTCFNRLYKRKLLVKFAVNKTFNFESTELTELTEAPSKSTKFILYWLPMWNSKTFSFNTDGFDLFDSCEINNCFATHNKNIIPLENFDAIIFHAAQYNVKAHGKPSVRKPNQRYIFATMEPPARFYPSNLEKFRTFYNWTMTYRYDSDIFLPYGYIVKNETNYISPSLEYFKNKTKLVAWFVSNCLTINRREIIYRSLKQFIDIDVFGVCGTYTCPKKFFESAPKCYDLIENNYKFYLSFENSHCKDYVTEKLYRLLERNIVPVVYGYVNYSQVAPPNSVIVADYYSNVQELAHYLRYLDRNITEYMKFFEWKKLYYVNRDDYKTACKLCKMLHDPSEPQKIYEDILLWWLGKNHSHCKVGEHLPKISYPSE